MSTVQKESMEQRIFEYVKFAILNKDIAPGTQLVENVICEQLNVSRTPVRAAFKRLAGEGIINIVTNKGAFVIQPSFEEISQLYDARCKLEMLMLDLAFEEIGEADLSYLEQLTALEEESYVNKDVECYFDCNRQFHTYFAEKYGNMVLLDAVDKAVKQSNVYTTLYDVLYHYGTPYSAREHRALIELMRKKDKQTYKKILPDHILETLNNLEKNMIAYKPLKGALNNNKH